jgi:hypothetical protein
LAYTQGRAIEKNAASDVRVLANLTSSPLF